MLQYIQLLASEMDSVDLSQLDENTIRNMRQLQVGVFGNRQLEYEGFGKLEILSVKYICVFCMY